MSGAGTRAGDGTGVARPAVAGVAVTDLSAAGGAVLWAGAVLAGDLTEVERALALAPLVVVPLGLGIASAPDFDGLAGRFATGAVALQPVGAALVLGSLLVDSGPLAALAAAAWLPVTGLLALAGLARTLDRGLARTSDRGLAETLVDAGLAYTTVAAVALVLYHLDVTFWFTPTIVFLTAVHFHFAGFALPVLAGVAGRSLDEPGPIFRPLGGVILVGPAFIAVGISFSPLVEVVAVGAFTLAVAAFGVLVLVRVVPRCSPLAGAFVGLSALALPASMALALGYGVAAFTGTNPLGLGLDVATMVSLHGSLNAYGFALCGVVGWRLAERSNRG